jgi:hypothetical protein
MSLFGPIVTCRCAERRIKIFNVQLPAAIWLIHTCSPSSTRTTRARIPSQLMSMYPVYNIYNSTWSMVNAEQNGDTSASKTFLLPTASRISDPSFGISAYAIGPNKELLEKGRIKCSSPGPGHWQVQHVRRTTNRRDLDGMRSAGPFNSCR